MKDFNLAKYLKENYQGPFSMFQPYVDLNPLKEESEEQLDTEIPYKGPDPHLDGMGSDFEQAEPVEEIVDGDSVIDTLTQEYGEWLDQNNLPQISADELLYDDSIEKTEEQKQYLKNFIDKWDAASKMDIDEAFGAEQEKYDRMMGLIDTTLEAQLPKIKRAVDRARDMMISDMSIFNMLATNSLTKNTVDNLVKDGFDKQDIVDFFATDFTIDEDGDNVTAADNAAYGADQQAGEPFEEEVTVSSSGVEM